MEDQLLDIQIPARKIYRERQIQGATFLGGPLVAGYMIAENYRAFNEPEKVRKTWIITLIATVIIFGGVFLIPEEAHIPNIVIPLIYTMATYYLVKQYQGDRIAAHFSAGGQAYSIWRAIGVAAVGAVILLVAIVAAALMIGGEGFH